MRVIKLGGSLLSNALLSSCLQQIAATHTRAIIVAGGGVFADQVRLTQQQFKFSESAAHHMAILAMQQVAVLINALQPNWPLVSSLVELKQRSIQEQTSIWLPELALLNQYQIPATWQITSDSLAAWLAQQLKATDLIIVKAASISATVSCADLIKQGILDDAFLDYMPDNHCNIQIINSNDFMTQNAST